MSRLLEAHYAFYNRRYFRNRLPVISVGWWDGKRGNTRWKNIVGRTFYDLDEKKRIVPTHILLHPRLKQLPSYCKLVLFHEMAHVATPHRVHHGIKFQRQMQRLAKIGAFRELW